MGTESESPKSHISLLILIIIYILFSSYMINQLEDNSIKKTNEIQNLKMELDITNDKLINCKSEILNREVENIEENKSEWKKFFVTGYTAGSGEQGTNFTVNTMFNLNLSRVQNLPIIAVDPEVIPLYSIVEIKDLGVFIALDTGGLIKGNKIDVLCQDIETAYKITGEYSIRILKKGMSLAD